MALDSKVVFLDRDGTVNVDHEYVASPSQVELVPGAAEGIALLRKEGFSIVIVSNQSGIARGFMSLKDVEAVNQRVIELLAEEAPDALVDRVLICPHRPEENCACRKPEIGMLPAELKFAPNRSWMVGDKISDLEFGWNLGLPRTQSLLVLSGKGEQTLAKHPDLVAFSSLREAARHIVGL